jgi:hypothetical protein
VKRKFPSPPATIVVDDSPGTPIGVPLAPRLLAQLQKEELSLEAPARTNGYGATSPYNNGYSGDVGKAGSFSLLRPRREGGLLVADRAINRLRLGRAVSKRVLVRGASVGTGPIDAPAPTR